MNKPILRCIKFTIAVMSILFATLILSACSGGGGGEPPLPPNPTPNPTPISTTQFAGGTMAELKTLNPNLKFDHLEISGRLNLDINSSETISVNSMTVTADGSITYTYTECSYPDAPSISIEASGDVIVEGNIRLNGRSGHRVASSATCRSCNGADGGNITISAERIIVKGKIHAYGGDGSAMNFVGMPSSGCDGGASGDVRLTANEIDLGGAEIDNRRGDGGKGGGSTGNDGASGNLDLVTQNIFKMLGGSVFSTGHLTFEAGQTDISGPITYGTFQGTIGGEQDATPPDLSIQSPVDSSSFKLDEPIDVTVKVGDAGMGVKEIQITGFGYDQTHSCAEVVDGLLTVQIPSAKMPASLDVTVWDNAGNINTDSVSQLSVSYKQETEPNDDFSGAQDLTIPDLVEANIHSADTGSTNALIQEKNGGEKKIEDWYAFTVDQYSNITLSIDFSDSNESTDLDLYLFNETATELLAQSIEDNRTLNNYTETITGHIMPGNYVVGVRAWITDKSEAYTIRIKIYNEDADT